MLTTLLPISHWQQEKQADCLAACAAMILAYLQLPVNYPRIRRLLNVRYFGAFFSNLVRLDVLGVAVTVDEGNLDIIEQYLETGLPVIVAVHTSYLNSYWSEAVSHAMVVVGMENDVIYINDPAFTTAPQIVLLNEFMAAWAEKDFLYAVIELE